MNNEKFVFTFGDNHNETFYEYIPVTNLTELLDPNLVIVSIRSGLGDQICKYIYGKVIEKYTGKKVLYETTQCVSFNGFEVQKISTEKINLLSDILSKRLYKARIYKNLFLKISESSNYITTSLDSFKGEDIALGNLSGCYLGGNNLEMYIVNSLPYQFHNTLVRVEQLMSCFNFEIRDYLKFPPFITEQHKKLAEIILSCDSVIIHVRRGDYLTVGFDIDNEFYVDAVSEVMKLDQYSNKKFFVFSDDIPWCKANTEAIGLNQIEDCELFFVEDNREDESFRDMQLMSLGKIMIIGKSYFSRVAAMYNNNIEILISSSRSLSNKLALQKGLSKIIDLGSKQYQEYKEDRTPRNISTPHNLQTIDNRSPATTSNNAGGGEGIINGREYIEWLNFWFDNANEKRTDRILLIGDSISRDYRGLLAQLTKKPVDFFATTTSISDDKFYKTLDLFFSYEEYRQSKAHIQIGVHGIDGVEKAVQNNSIEEFEKAYEKLVNYILKYIPDLTIALTTSVVEPQNLSKVDEKINNEIIKRNKIAKKVAEKYKLPLNDLYNFMFNESHRDWVHFSKEGNEKIARKVAEVMKLI